MTSPSGKPMTCSTLSQTGFTGPTNQKRSKVQKSRMKSSKQTRQFRKRVQQTKKMTKRKQNRARQKQDEKQQTDPAVQKEDPTDKKDDKTEAKQGETKDSDEDSSADEDIDAALTKNIVAAVATRQRKQFRFQAVRCGVASNIYIKARLPDPLPPLTAALEDIRESRKARTRALARLLPVQCVCPAYHKDIEKALTAFCAENDRFADQGACKTPPGAVRMPRLPQ